MVKAGRRADIIRRPSDTKLAVLVGDNRPVRYTGIMTRGEVKEILDRVLSWPDDDQAKIVRFVGELEQWHADHVIVDEAGAQANGHHRNR